MGTTAQIRITAQAFNKSIEIALREPPDPEASISRIKRAINSLPSGKLYASDHGSEVSFYTKFDGRQKYVSKRSPIIHALARKSYLILLQEIFELIGSDKPADVLKRNDLIAKLQDLISKYERGNLDLAKIVLTSSQYKWFTGNFAQKMIDKTKAYRTSCGLYVRSNSEKNIINESEGLAVPLHYEERQFIDVHSMVNKLQDDLQSQGILRGNVFEFLDGELHWNVPPKLEWMNARGSIWMSYYPPNGLLMIYNDFRVMFADGTIFIWEHEGMMDDFVYRCNATERTAVMKMTHTVSKENLLETCEEDIDTPEKLIHIIEKNILPRLWF